MTTVSLIDSLLPSIGGLTIGSLAGDARLDCFHNPPPPRICFLRDVIDLASIIPPTALLFEALVKIALFTQHNTHFSEPSVQANG